MVTINIVMVTLLMPMIILVSIHSMVTMTVVLLTLVAIAIEMVPLLMGTIDYTIVPMAMAMELAIDLIPFYSMVRITVEEVLI